MCLSVDVYLPVPPQGMNEDVSAQKGKARDALSAGKKLLNDHSLDDEAEVRTKMDQLKQKADSVSVTANERLSTLEQALPLARHFREAHGDLVRWLDEVEPAIDLLDTPSVDAEQVKKQQEKAKVSVFQVLFFSESTEICVQIGLHSFCFDSNTF